MPAEKSTAALPAERYVHPLTPEEHAEVVLAVKVMIDVLPSEEAFDGLDIMGDARTEARTRLVSALDKLEAHWCAWCPLEVRDLAAVAHNAAVNSGNERARKKMGDLFRALNAYEPIRDAHFRAINEWDAKQPLCDRLPGCGIKPGGHFHDPECAVEKSRRR